MKRKRIDPLSPEMFKIFAEEVRNMTPQERRNLISYRPPGVEETDMTGMFGLYEKADETSCEALPSVSARVQIPRNTGSATETETDTKKGAVKRKRPLDPNSPELAKRIAERIRGMTPQELINFLNYRTPGVEETDMTGMYGLYKDEDKTLETPREPAEKVAA